MYEIRELLGAGGMGEVYLAHDARLGRDVAVKVLPADYATDQDRVRRFEREARAAAALNHPNILAVYDVGVHDGAPFIVAERLAGVTLREYAHGAALPVRKATDIAIQIARGLAAAHDQGVVHRDLKPENIFVTDAGLVKILDFGLAKLTERPSAQTQDDASTRRPDTQPGVVMGTAGYMSPEQVRGLAVDHRSDIFAFGAVLYELISGQRAFRGDTTMDVATAILKEDPPDLPTAERRIPPALTRIVERCLAKTPGARFQSAGDLGFALEALSASSGSSTTTPAIPGATRRGLSWPVAMMIGLVLGVVVMYVAFDRPAPAASDDVATTFPLAIPEGSLMTLSVGAGRGVSPGPLAVSPNGRHIAYIANAADGIRSLWVRSRDDITPLRIAGTEGVLSPFWSPDSERLAFFANGKLKRVDRAGGSPTDICDAANTLGGTWSRRGVILFGVNTPGGGIQRVADSGGVPAAVTTVDEGETLHSRPIFLPDGNRFLFRVLTPGMPARGWVYVGSLDSANRTKLVEIESSNIAYSAGHLLFLRGPTLVAQPFDVDRAAMTGEPFPVIDSVRAVGTVPVGVFSAAENGVMVYLPGSITRGSELQVFDRSGKTLRKLGEPGVLSDVRMSHDGTHVMFSRPSSSEPAGTSDLWTIDTRTGQLDRITFDAGDELAAAFSPDDKRVAFNSSRRGPMDLFVKPADGGAETELFTNEQNKAPGDWSPDGKHLLFVSSSGTFPGGRRVTGTGGEGFGRRGGRGPGGAAPQKLWILPLDGDRTPFRLTPDGPGAETPGGFSPDGRWIVFASTETPNNEVFVVPFPPTGPKWQISIDGGGMPRWSRDGQEIFFIAAGPSGPTLMSARVDGRGAALKRLDIKALFSAPIAGARSAFAPFADGQRFVVNTMIGATDRTPAIPIVVMDWLALRKTAK